MKTMVGIAAAIATQLLFSCGGGSAKSSAPETASTEEALHSGTSCNGTLTGSVASNVVVRSGATCTLTSATVHGSIFVEAGALGLTASGSAISGRVDIRDVSTGTFSLSGSSIPGFITVSNLGSGASLKLCGNGIGGSVVLSGNRGAVTIGTLIDPSCGGNSIFGFVTITGNRGAISLAGDFVKEDVNISGSTASGTETLSGNNIEDNLLCSHNATPPALAGNTIGGTNSCGPQAVCGPGQTRCADAACHDLQSDANDCGACQHVCGAGLVCTAGACAPPACPSGQTRCGGDGLCHDLQSDANDCGSCGHACATGQSCTAGTCGVPGPIACDGGTDLETGDAYVVCAADASSIWVSANSSGTYHAEQICTTLGYTTLTAFGGNCGSVCGYCDGAHSCSAHGAEVFDGAGDRGNDAFGKILNFTVTWKCTR